MVLAAPRVRTQADKWGGPHTAMTLKPALDTSYEAQFHKQGIDQFFIVARPSPDITP